MGWLSSLGFELVSSESWQEFLIWMGWNSFNESENGFKEISFVLLPTTRSASLYLAFGYLLKTASVSGGVQLLKLSEIDCNTKVYFRFSQKTLTTKQITTGIYSGKVIPHTEYPFGKKVVLEERVDRKQKLIVNAIGSSRRRFSLQKLHKLNTSEITMFLESFGYTDASDSFLSKTSVVDILSSNKRVLMNDMEPIMFVAKHPDTKEETYCKIDELLACKSATQSVTNIRSGSRLEFDGEYKFQHIIVDGARAFFNNDPWVLNTPSITVLLSQQEFASPDVRGRLESLLEKRCQEDRLGADKKLPAEMEIPVGMDILNFRLRRNGCG